MVSFRIVFTIQPQLGLPRRGIRSVATNAFVGQDGANVPIEIDRRISGERGREKGKQIRSCQPNDNKRPNTHSKLPTISVGNSDQSHQASIKLSIHSACGRVNASSHVLKNPKIYL